MLSTTPTSVRGPASLATPSDQRESGLEIAGRLGADQLMISSVIADPVERLASYELVASAFE